MKPERILLIFTRYPEPGLTKTRLIPGLGEKGAADVQKEMTEYTVRQARLSGAQIEVRYCGGSEEQMRSWLGPDLIFVEQGEGNLGARMQRAFHVHVSKSNQQVVLIGADCPANDAQNLCAAFDALERVDCVIGPAADGGYYLIGLKADAPQLFKGMAWGKECVLEQTLRAASGLSVKQLAVKSDVDFPEDLPPKISVIIPALNEQESLGETLDQAMQGFRVEILVVDGGSTDSTVEVAQERGVQVFECKEGRAAQQNLGACKASGTILLFLHADTLLPGGWDWMVRNQLDGEHVVLGAFAFKVREQFKGLRLIESATNWRSRIRQLPYGDQGLFLHKDVFDSVKGFPDMPIMEDYAFVMTLRSMGRVATLRAPALTSGRRWVKRGVFKVTLINQWMILGYHLGLDPERLAGLYRGPSIKETS